jgi:hypothetical protein
VSGILQGRQAPASTAVKLSSAAGRRMVQIGSVVNPSVSQSVNDLSGKVKVKIKAVKAVKAWAGCY